MRLFFAINLGERVRRELADAAAPVRAAALSVKWVDPRLYHFTLKFLGQQPESRVEALRDALSRLASRHRRLVMDLGDVGAFPNFRRPRVVWVGVTADPRLELLHHDVELACASLGVEPDGRPFRPHLTLGRVKSPLNGQEARALSTAADSTAYRAEVDVSSVDLMQSVLGAGGPRYATVFSAPLRSE